MASERFEVVEICAGAGGQSLGLHRAGFHHRLAVELDSNAAKTLAHNLARLLVAEDGMSQEQATATAEDIVRVGDVADAEVWRPEDHEDVDLLAGGVPCPPFSIAGKQLGATDERDLFAWAIELLPRVRPKALLLENVKGLSGSRFSAYRQHVLGRLHKLGYTGEWRLLQASDFGVSQLRPRFVLIAMQSEYFEYFHWPAAEADAPPTVGHLLEDLMAENGWSGAAKWVGKANKIAPTIVGGSKKHGGADLGPTRAKAAWREMGVDALGVADHAPTDELDADELPKLTTAMVARIQGWGGEGFEWEFLGRKTSVYRQIGNAFPPPVAYALGSAIASALRKDEKRADAVQSADPVLDPVYVLLSHSKRPLTAAKIVELLEKSGKPLALPQVEAHLTHIQRDFHIETSTRSNGEQTYQLGEFKAFIGQQDHVRHESFARQRSRIS